MPLVNSSQYTASHLFKNGHINTIYSAHVDKRICIAYQRERLITPDQDFIDLDWAKIGSSRLILVTHGLEGSSNSSYIKRFVTLANAANWDVLAWNLRGCSGVPNLKLKSYHSGSSDDLQLVFSHALFKKEYQEIVLVGFSLGGNITLKFLGEQSSSVAGLVSGAVAISTPCDLEAAANNLNRWQNLIYRRHFLNSMRSKLSIKQKLYPGYLSSVKASSLKTFFDFDNYYTAPVHGFRTATEYWRICSSKHYIPMIEVPTLILNAQDDPLLTGDCMPLEAAKNSKFVFFENPLDGGHVGFYQSSSNTSYATTRTLDFFENHVTTSRYSYTSESKAA